MPRALRSLLARRAARTVATPVVYHPRLVRYMRLVWGTGALLAAVNLHLAIPQASEWGTTLALAAALAALADAFPVRVRYLGSVSLSAVLYCFAIVVLPPPAAVLVPLVSGLLYGAGSIVAGTWNPRRSAFNIAQLVISLSAGAYTLSLIGDHNPHLFSTVSDYGVVLVAGITYFIVNTALVARVSAVVHRLPLLYVWRVNYQGFVLYFLGLLSAGCLLAVLWQERPLTLPLTAGLAVLLHKAITVPNLLAESRTDSKTGLYNVQHFYRVIEDELKRAARFGRPLSVVMADLDYLREINNTYGHLAGDVVIAGAARVIRNSVREYEVAARFGGEEFALLLLETTRGEALEVAERIRVRFAVETFSVPNSTSPISATVSLGVSYFPEDGTTVEGLVHAADMALHAAKGAGRNRVLSASQSPSQAE